MQKLKQIYRATYDGEQVVTELRLGGTEWSPTTEFIPNRVNNNYTTKQAVVIGNGESRLGFDLSHIASHKGGLFAVDKLQSYGCNALYRDFQPDFLVTTGKDIATEIAESGYLADHIVYANAEQLISYPGQYYLIPQNLHYDAGSLAVYLACFDGHKKIFMMGFDSYDTAGQVNNVYKNTNGYPESPSGQSGALWDLTLSIIASTYNEVEFIRVMPTKEYWTPEALNSLPNFRQISIRDFINEADIG